MPLVADQLRQYAAAMADPIASAILIELDRVGAATPVAFACELGLSIPEIYQHIRVLRSHGVIELAEPDTPGQTTERMITVSGELRAALRIDPSWLNRMGTRLPWLGASSAASPSV